MQEHTAKVLPGQEDRKVNEMAEVTPSIWVKQRMAPAETGVRVRPDLAAPMLQKFLRGAKAPSGVEGRSCLRQRTNS